MLLAFSALALSLFFFFRGRSRKTKPAVERLLRFHGFPETEAQKPKEKHLKQALVKFVELPNRLLPETLKEKLSADLVKYVPLSGFSIEELLGMRSWGILCFPLLLVMLFRFSTFGLFLAAPSAGLGAMLPVYLADRNRKTFLDAVRAALPNTADMLYAFVLGGRNLDQAFRGAAEVSPEPLHSLLAQAVREMELGCSRAESFARLSVRCPLAELSSLLRTLIEAEKRGHPLSGTLEIFSREIRLRRRDQLRVAVAKAPLKMLAPLVFLILPASILLTIGPTFLTMLYRFF